MVRIGKKIREIREQKVRESATQQQSAQKPTAQQQLIQQQEEPKNKWLLPVAIGGGVLILGAILYFGLRKK